MSSTQKVDPSLCPLCGKQNLCSHAQKDPVNSSCWCHSVDVHFSSDLLASVPNSHKNKACICRQCAESASKKKHAEC